jgi:transposase
MAFQPVEETNRGRPKRLEVDDTLTDTLADYLRSGLFLREACSLAGVNRDSVYTWLKKGTRDRKKGEDSVEARFTDTIKRAMAEAEADALNDVRNAAKLPQFWAAGAWYLERRYPEKYGRKDRLAMEHSGQMGVGIVEADSTVAESLEDDEKREAAKRIAESLAIIGSPPISTNRGADSASEFGDEWQDDDSETSFLSEFGTD